MPYYYMTGLIKILKMVLFIVWLAFKTFSPFYNIMVIIVLATASYWESSTIPLERLWWFFPSMFYVSFKTFISVMEE